MVYNSSKTGLILCLGMALPPIIGLCWTIPVIIHMKKKTKHNKKTSQE